MDRDGIVEQPDRRGHREPVRVEGMSDPEQKRVTVLLGAGDQRSPFLHAVLRAVAQRDAAVTESAKPLSILVSVRTRGIELGLLDQVALRVVRVWISDSDCVRL